MPALVDGLDVAGDEQRNKFLTSILSLILFSRGSFPRDCFRKVSRQDMSDPGTTHAKLITSGSILNPDEPRAVVLSDLETYLYLRKCPGNHRMHSFLNALREIFSLVDHQRLGKIQICFMKSKIWDANALLEFFSLKFSYTELGHMYVYVDWGATESTPVLVNCPSSLHEFLKSRPPFDTVTYNHVFLSSIDGKPLAQGLGSGMGRHMKDAILKMQRKRNSGSGRIAKIPYRPSKNGVPATQKRKRKRSSEKLKILRGQIAEWTANGLKQTRIDEDKLEKLAPSRTGHQEAQAPLVVRSPDWVRNKDQELPSFLLQDAHPEDQSQAKSEVPPPKYNCSLAVIEEVSEDSLPKQQLQTQQHRGSDSSQKFLALYRMQNDQNPGYSRKNSQAIPAQRLLSPILRPFTPNLSEIPRQPYESENVQVGQATFAWPF